MPSNTSVLGSGTLVVSESAPPPFKGGSDCDTTTGELANKINNVTTISDNFFTVLSPLLNLPIPSLSIGHMKPKEYQAKPQQYRL